MRNRGRMMVCVLALALIMAGGAATAQTTQPAPKGSELKRAPTENTPNTPAGPATTKPTTQPVVEDSGWSSPQMLLLVGAGALFLMMILSGRGRRKEQAKHREMLANLKKGDKIQTIGGIIGTVIEVRADEVTVKVDETNNVRMRFSRRAIHVVGDAKSDVKGGEEEKK